MTSHTFEFTYDVVDDISQLSPDDAAILKLAREATAKAYAPYSNFHVGAAARLSNNAIVTGTNQENASYPVTICAERVLLGVAATLHPGVAIDTLAISYSNQQQPSDHPISPCGMCRQALVEYEDRTHQPIRLLLSGQSGKVYILHTSSSLLPLAFTGAEL